MTADATAPLAGIESIKALLPDFARDLRINLGVIAGSTALTPAQAWTVAVASARTARNAVLARALEADAAAAGLADDALAAARAAAAVMGMNNVYYRFVHHLGEGAEYGQMPARLRMQVIGKPGIPHLDFELACLAASAINGCEACVRAHEQTVREKGGSKEAVQDAVRIAAVVHGAAVALEAAT